MGAISKERGKMMKNKILTYMIIFVAIILTASSVRALELFKQNVQVFNNKENSTGEFQEKQEGMEEVPKSNEIERVFKDTYIRREKLIQSYIHSITKKNREKVAYLTFDDGPSPNVTTEILDILKREDAKATFFVVGSNVKAYPHILKRIHEEGHTVGNHTYSHNYNRIYKNPTNYIEDLLKGEEAIKSVLGEDYELTLTRFPGGSFGNKKEKFRKSINEAGYVYIDWNSLNGDGEGVTLSKEYLLDRFEHTSKGKDVLVILMHDSSVKTTTVDSLTAIIKKLKREGYKLKALPQFIEIEGIKDNATETLTN